MATFVSTTDSKLLLGNVVRNHQKEGIRDETQLPKPDFSWIYSSVPLTFFDHLLCVSTENKTINKTQILISGIFVI